MHNDDRQVGALLSRRQTLKLFGAAGAALVLGCSRNGNATAGSQILDGPCVVRPEQTEGPYFSDVMLNRSDIRSDPGTGIVKDGVPLELTIRINNASDGCTPLRGAAVDIWHCDALGAYSDFRTESTAGEKFLRGYQITDDEGQVHFTTIYPGGYQGRRVHIHFKVRTRPSSFFGEEFTSQLYLDDSVTDLVHANAPYAGKGRRMRNSEDGVFRNGGSRLLLKTVKTSQGYSSAFDMGMHLR